MNNWNRIGLVTLVGLPLVLAACSDLASNLGLGDAQSQEQKATWPHERGKQQFAAGNYGLAAKHFQQAVTHDGSSIEALNGLAATYDKMGRFDLAERYYRQALVVDPQSEQSLNNLGYSYLLQGKYDLALAYLRDAQALGQDNPVILANRDFAGASLQSSVAAKASADVAAGSAQQVAVVASAKLKVERASSIVQTLKIEAETEPQPSIDSVVQQFAVPLTGTEPQLFTDAGVQRFAVPLGAKPAKSPKKSALQPAPLAVEVEEVVQVALLAPLPETDDAGTIVFDVDDHGFLASPGPEFGSGLVTSLVEVTNGVGRNDMAARMRGYLKSRGMKVAWLTNADQFDHAQSTIFYQEGWRVQAEALAATLPLPVTLTPAAGQRAQLRLRLGRDLLEFDNQLQSQLQRVSDDTPS